MTNQICPHLGTLDNRNRRAASVEYPSFENQCFAGEAAGLVMLGDQATYCLSGECKRCPRFRTAARQAETPGAFAAVDPEEAWRLQSEAAAGVLGLDNAAFMAESAATAAPRRHWAWAAAGLLFMVALLCGSMVTAYTGWQWVSRNLPASVAAGRVDTVATAREPAQPPAVQYLVLTATPAPTVAVSAVQPPASGAAAPAQPAPLALNLPAAVTPTPIVIQPAGSSAGQPAVSLPAVGQASTPAPVVDVELLVPTRRPTPEFDLPTSTPLPAPPTPVAEAPTATPQISGTPWVVFAPAQSALMKGECTFVRWTVRNVREVYYENLPVNGQGEREECMDKRAMEYKLMVILGDGAAQVYTTTIEYLAPTPTPSATPSFTPEPIYTPTWTPAPPTETPTPNVFRAVGLSLNGNGDIACSQGQTCEIGLLVTNGGSAVDDLSVIVMEGNPLPMQLCRADGVCSGSALPISSVGPANTAYIVAKIAVPGDAAAQSAGWTFQAFSQGSNGAVSSLPVSIQVTVP